MNASKWKSVLMRLGLELVVYGVLLFAYFLLALSFLAKPMGQLFQGNLLLYGVVGVGLIIAQAVLLDVVTSFLVEHLGIERLK